MLQKVKEMCQDYHTNVGISPFLTVLFQSNYACIHQTTFIDHGKETICLYEIGVLCNTTSVLCDIRIALCDMDPL